MLYSYIRLVQYEEIAEKFVEDVVIIVNEEF